MKKFAAIIAIVLIAGTTVWAQQQAQTGQTGQPDPGQAQAQATTTTAATPATPQTTTPQEEKPMPTSFEEVGEAYYYLVDELVPGRIQRQIKSQTVEYFGTSHMLLLQAAYVNAGFTLEEARRAAETLKAESRKGGKRSQKAREEWLAVLAAKVAARPDETAVRGIVNARLAEILPLGEIETEGAPEEIEVGGKKYIAKEAAADTRQETLGEFAKRWKRQDSVLIALAGAFPKVDGDNGGLKFLELPANVFPIKGDMVQELAAADDVVGVIAKAEVATTAAASAKVVAETAQKTADEAFEGLAAKADATAVYTKDEVDDFVDGVHKGIAKVESQVQPLREAVAEQVSKESKKFKNSLAPLYLSYLNGGKEELFKKRFPNADIEQLKKEAAELQKAGGE